MTALLVPAGHMAYWTASIAMLAIAAWLLRSWAQARAETAGAEPSAVDVALFAALIATSLWAGVAGFATGTSLGALATESLRNLGWLAFLFQLVRTAPSRPPTLIAVYAVLALIALLQPLAFGLVASTGTGHSAAYLLRMIFALGALLLANNLYSIADGSMRERLRVPLLAIGALWFVDLNQYLVAWMSGTVPAEFAALRGFITLLLAPLFALAVRRKGGWTLTLSRKMAYGSVSIIGAVAYLLAMILVIRLLQALDSEIARGVQLMVFAGVTLTALMLAPSRRFRAWFKVKIAKHLFRHRYDYRSEWLRFTQTIGRPGDGTASFHERVVKALSDITDSPGGLLLVPGDSGRLELRARFNWPLVDVPAAACTGSTLLYFQTSGRIVELDALRRGADDDTDRRAIPDWILAAGDAWALVPLVHFDRLAGLVVLARPLVDRDLDWEDFDLLRVAGRQVASFLAEASAQEALLVNERFDEFNRRFAFVMHDIKNLVSQLSLVARNAERHADNPEFRADMVATLQNSVAKMNGLIARLSRYAKADQEATEPVQLANLVRAVVEDKNQRHPVQLVGSQRLTVQAPPLQLEQVIAHLVQNAIDASPHGHPVFVQLAREDLSARIDIVDNGCGMSPEFVRTKLFRPFVSIKPDGFGIGAYEAKTLIEAMNGRIDVESREGSGSRFVVRLPLMTRLDGDTAAPAQLSNPLAERLA